MSNFGANKVYKINIEKYNILQIKHEKYVLQWIPPAKGLVEIKKINDKKIIVIALCLETLEI